MQTKNVPALIKASGDDTLTEGQFTAIVSVFNTVDSVGDVVMPGAFKADLEAWASKGTPLPVVWSHDWADPFSHIGHVLEAKETDTGLQVKGQLDLDNPKAKQVYNLLKGGRVRNWSFAYDINDAQQAHRDGKSVQELHRLSVHEVGPTLVGAHKDTDTVAVKQAPGVTVTVTPAVEQPRPDVGVVVDSKAADGAVARLVTALDSLDAELAAAQVETKAAPPGFTPKPIVARIRKIAAAVQALLDAVEPDSTSDDSKAMPAQPSQPEPPTVVAAGPDPVRHGTASSRLRIGLELLELEAASYTV